MDLIDWITNLAALLLWVEWRSGTAFARMRSRPTISIANSLREAEPSRWRGWRLICGLLLLLVVRGFFYWNIGSALEWTPRTNLLVIALPWRSDLLERMMTYSFVSFLGALGVFFSALLLCSAVRPVFSEENAVERFVRLQLGFLDKLPGVLKLLLVPMAAALAWSAAAPLLVKWEMLPAIRANGELWRQAGVLALASLLSWKWVILVLFGLHFLNLYVYLGTHPIWPYVSKTASKLLGPLRFLRFGRVDVSPIAGIALLWVLAEQGIRPLIARLF